ncbi:hypothetical protein GCM10007160_16750 [Litchfieldella qijiaojingensis]|uniref:DNA-binding protein n=1 Tax=Litchfieldella qijiaojingensis TaxID=980347 RepID=A0ABQ2YN79_9GAMM|nr:hypothetical protein [Halomonas qijiaojingensis]GGX89975.1 hypothetical protein GCM10007160_16750 [Halomonas qijiaojingensis]
MSANHQDPTAVLAAAMARYRAGDDPGLIELPESAVFPHLIHAQPTTARKSRVTGVLLGRPTPMFVKRGRSIRYRLSDVLAWLSEGEAVGSTAEAGMAEGMAQ